MSKVYGAVKERLGLTKPWEAAYWQPHKIESFTALVRLCRTAVDTHVVVNGGVSGRDLRPR